jgi:EAL domain-containing protein (putative c-di-GMP-specific phosphodiesterase class I)
MRVLGETGLKMADEPTLALSGEPFLEYQPAVDLATGRLLGFEALLRWKHPTKGTIPPGVLIPWAEANNSIVPLNSWVLEEACHHAAQWSSALQLAVNCSLVQLHQGQASVAVTNAIEKSGLNPDRLTIEVTEGTIADDRASADLRAVTALGVHLAVDDVGTSWSSLRSLRKFDIETVKIDRAFISSLEAEEGMNRAIVDAIIHVAHSIAMSVVAEGIETAHQVEILRDFHADVGQGFFFAPPMSLDRANELGQSVQRAIFALTQKDARAEGTTTSAKHLKVLKNDPSDDPQDDLFGLLTIGTSTSNSPKQSDPDLISHEMSVAQINNAEPVEVQFAPIYDPSNTVLENEFSSQLQMERALSEVLESSSDQDIDRRPTGTEI